MPLFIHEKIKKKKKRASSEALEVEIKWYVPQRSHWPSTPK